ncbi:MAG TPA: tetratricopeptide repeat protein [Pirellulaceae bacterium]|nr:tetratricopeptide repeat protein [Pirellulaceae bacterium]
MNENENENAPQPSAPSLLRYWPAASAIAVLVLVGLAVASLPRGCRVDPQENVAQTQITEDLAQPVDDLTLATGALETIPLAGESMERAHYYFNKWMHQQDGVEVDEKLDPLIDNLPRTYRHDKLPQELRRRIITQGDIFYLLQCAWFRDVSGRVADAPLSGELAPWLEEQEKSLGIDDAGKLATAARLFDWTIRNIQLDPLPPPPAPPKAIVGAADPASALASKPGPLRGELGPGYGQLPWQTLLYGHGDAWERARTFILLSRQAGLDVVMLAIPEMEGAGGNRPWLPALLLKGQLYLFDTGLGLPIPGPAGRGIATLEQVVADESLLEQLDLPGDDPYPIHADDLTAVSALIDAELASLTVRMRLLEPAIVGKRKMTLVTRPSELKKELEACKHVSGVSLWRVAIEAELYQAMLPEALERDPPQRLARERLIRLFEPGRPLMHARHLHLQGKFDTPPDEESQLGARQRYSQLRLSDKRIESVDDSLGREILGLGNYPLPSDPAERKAELDNMMAVMRIARQHATYWIALSHAETGNNEIAVEWFRDLVLTADPDTPWQTGARYNLGRCYEALGKWDQARQIYLTDDSPQRHGNVLRAAAISRERGK